MIWLVRRHPQLCSGVLCNQIDLLACFTLENCPLLGPFGSFPANNYRHHDASCPRGQEHYLGAPLFTGNLQGKTLNIDSTGLFGGAGDLQAQVQLIEIAVPPIPLYPSTLRFVSRTQID